MKKHNNKALGGTQILSRLIGLPFFFAMFITLNCKSTKYFKDEIRHQPFQFTDVETGMCSS